MSDRHDLRSRIHQLLKFIEQQLAAIVNGRNPQACSLLLREDLPGHDVRVVLHGGDEDLVTGADMSATIGLGDQVDGFRGATHKDNLFQS